MLHTQQVWDKTLGWNVEMQNVGLECCRNIVLLGQNVGVSMAEIKSWARMLEYKILSGNNGMPRGWDDTLELGGIQEYWDKMPQILE